ncbi:hypothetical protein LJB42_002758 [Komagataella kurtzmanii]|nr:hypothetical protein LJB42_002758 [Komagataella kurtzmanii]
MSLLSTGLGILIFTLIFIKLVPILVLCVFSSFVPLLGLVWLSLKVRRPSLNSPQHDNLALRFPRFKFITQLNDPKPEDTFRTIQSGDVQAKFDLLFDSIIRDFVLSWHKNITQDSSFPEHLKIYMTEVVLELQERLRDTNFTRLVVLKLLPIVVKHYDGFLGTNTTVHPASSSREDTSKHLNKLVDRFVWILLPNQESKSRIVRIIVREILTTWVISPITCMLSDPDYYNQKIVQFTSVWVEDNDHIQQFRSILNQQVKGSTVKHRKDLKDEKYQLLRQRILECESKDQLDRYKAYLSKSKLESHKVELLKELVDSLMEKYKDTDQLSDVLFNPDSFQKFKAFMEQRNNVEVLNFWYDVNQIKDPLESVSTFSSLSKSSLVDFGDKKVNEVKSLFNSYLNHQILEADSEIFANVQQLVNSRHPTEQVYRNARLSMLQLQDQVYEKMNQTDFELFKQSRYFNLVKEHEVEKQEDGFGDPLKNYEEDDNDDERIDSEDDSFVSENVLKAVEDALNEIVHDRNPLENSRASPFPPHVQNDDTRSGTRSPMKNSALFGLLGDKFFQEEEKKTEISDTESILSVVPDTNLTMAAPKDLNLSEEITKLSNEIINLENQLDVLLPLLRKAEVTNNSNELRILRKSKEVLEREIQFKSLQKQQYIVQESDNSLYAKSRIRISSFIDAEEEGKSFTLYIIEVQKVDDNNIVTAGWIVARRFSHFFKLNEYLKEQYPQQLAFVHLPKRKVVMKYKLKSLAEERMVQLEDYLQKLISISQVCDDRNFKMFLSSDIFEFYQEKKYDKFGRGLLSGKFLMPIPSFKGYSKKSVDLHNKEFEEKVREMQQELTTFNESSLRTGDVPFVKPICDLLISLFSTQKSNSWIKGRAMLIVLQQLLGSTIERKCDEYLEFYIKNETFVCNALDTLYSNLWPDGGPFRKSVERSPEVKSRTKHEAEKLIDKMFVGTFAKVFGETNSSYAGKNVFRLLQNQTLNTSLVLNLLDEITLEVFRSDLNNRFE